MFIGVFDKEESGEVNKEVVYLDEFDVKRAILNLLDRNGLSKLLAKHPASIRSRGELVGIRFPGFTDEAIVVELRSPKYFKSVRG